MQLFASVVVESDLIQLDREFDFIVPEAMHAQIKFGQRVRFTLGRAKKLAVGFVVAIKSESAFASSQLAEIVDLQPVLTEEVFRLARQVANRQCVSIGEILKQAIPDDMPRSDRALPEPIKLGKASFPKIAGVENLSNRAAILTSTRYISHEGSRHADWVWLFLQQAVMQLDVGKSAILIVPERDQIDQLQALAHELGIASVVSAWLPGQKKSERFAKFHEVLTKPVSLVIGTRSAIYAPCQNLGLISVFDDADDSLREQGSPFTHVREIAMMRCGENGRLVLAANYRSVEVQRLVQIGYLSDHSVKLPPARISFSAPATRLDSASFKLVKDALESGVVLVLLPRKGSSANVYCAGCSERLRCANCKGPVWESVAGKYECRVCGGISHGCLACGSDRVRRGRTGSERTAAEFGKAFPQIAIVEVTKDKKVSGLRPNKQIVIATPGAAPRISSGYQAVLILDTDVWLAMPMLRAEQVAIRDWMEAIELLSDTGRAHIEGIDADLGQAISLGQHREVAAKALREISALSLPPAARVATIEGTPETISTALAQLTQVGATILRSALSEPASALVRFSYNQGAEVSATLKALALKTNSRLLGTSKRRGLRIVMDDPRAL